MENRAKTERIVIRVGELDKRTIQAMADKAKMSITDFVLARIWGEDTHTQVSDAARSPVCVAPDAPISDKRAALLSIPGVSLGSQVFGDGVEVVKPVELRRFNANRPGWYDVLKRTEYGEVLQDRLDRRIWMHQGGKIDARLCATREEAEGWLGDLEF